MADFGANIVMQGIRNNQIDQQALFDRLMSIAQYGENKRQFNDTMAFNRTKPKDLSLQEQILQDVMAYKQGSATPEQMLRLQSYADMEGDKTQYQADAYGNVRAVTSPNPIGVMLGGGGAADKLFDTAGLEEMPAQPTPMRNSTGAGDMLFETSALPEVDPATAPDRPLNPEEFERMSLTGELPDALPTLPPASGNYSGSPVEDVERGKERAKVEAAGSMLPVKAAEARLQTDEELRKEQLKMEMNKEANKASKQADSNILFDDIDRALAIIDKKGIVPKTGTVGKTLSGYAETDAGRLSTILKSIKSQVGFSKMQDMRQNSPTGSTGLGALTEAEFENLASTSGSLAVGDNQKDLTYNLKRLYNQQKDMIHGTPEHIAKVAQEKGLPADVVESLSFRYPLRQTAGEGDIVRNPNTNERLILRNGSWEPLQ